MKRTSNRLLRNKLYIGIDNGVTGTIGAIYNDHVRFIKTPVFIEQNYTKAKANISRVDYQELHGWLGNLITEFNPESVFALIERPMLNPGRFKASISALRALEATLIAVERHLIAYDYIDSKKWQRELLAQGLKGPAELKADSKYKGIRLFPQFKEQIIKHKDADGLLIAEYCRRYF